MTIVAAILFFVLVLLIAESIVFNRNIKKLKIKIHVNGTRGKSTVTKYIWTALNDSGIKALGKVTGEIPTLLLPDGTRKEIKRNGAARVQEQFGIINHTVKQNASALVMECMSIDPSLQKLESKFIKPDIYVITNIRDDHQEQLGSNQTEQIEAFCKALPVKSKIIVSDGPYLECIKKHALNKQSQIIKAVSLNDDEMSRLPQQIFKANVEIAITVCLEVGISRKNALNSIIKQIDRNDKQVFTINSTSQNQYFLNAFSANDTQTTDEIINYWTEKLHVENKIALVLNTRSDRPLRTTLFTNWIKENDSRIDTVFLTGNHRTKAKQLLRKSNIKIKQLNNRSGIYSRRILSEIDNTIVLIAGIGNIKGAGYVIINEFSKAS
jgi:poly-gamma-glutamate synthase PgsB/CapB